MKRSVIKDGIRSRFWVQGAASRGDKAAECAEPALLDEQSPRGLLDQRTGLRQQGDRTDLVAIPGLVSGPLPVIWHGPQMAR
jgi:hypothetical protein